MIHVEKLFIGWIMQEMDRGKKRDTGKIDFFSEKWIFSTFLAIFGIFSTKKLDYQIVKMKISWKMLFFFTFFLHFQPKN